MKINYFLPFLIVIFTFMSLPSHLKAQVENGYGVTNATISTFITDRCTGQEIGRRTYTVNALFDPVSQKLNGTLRITGEGSVGGNNQNYITVTEFPIYNLNNEKIGTLPFTPPNHFPIERPFSINLNGSPKVIKALLYQTVTAGVCNGIFQDSDEFYFEGDVTNGTFQIPCPVVNKFQVTPNPVQPGGQVTIEWDVSNLFQSRFIRFSGPNLPPTDRYTQTGTLTFTAPATPGDFSYTLDVFDVNNSHVDGCSFPVTRPLVVSGGRYFWLVKRINPLAPTIPNLSPFEYYSETLASPHPPGSNPTGSFVRIPETGSFEAGTPESAQTLSPFNEDADAKLRQMKEADERRYPQIGLVTPDKNRAMAEYRNAFESYQQALNNFRNAQPKPGAGQIGPSNLVLVRKTNEEVSPYDK